LAYTGIKKGDKILPKEVLLTKKSYILDTNVLIHDPRSIFKFEDNNLYVPIYVLEELDKLKSEQSIRGRGAREACRLIDELRCEGSLSDGVPVGDGILKVYVPRERRFLGVGMENNSMDNAILQSALDIKESQELRAILVTMDVNLRIRADSLGIQSASYENQSIDPDQLISGIIDLEVEDSYINEMFKAGAILPPAGIDLYPNACIAMRSDMGRTALGRYIGKYKKICPLKVPKEGVMGIKPKNREQQFALDLLLDDDVKMVTLSGSAGGGKSLLAICAGFYKTFIEGGYTKMIVSRPVMPMGKDLGFLPGDMGEKMDPWMQPIYDNLELIMMLGGKKKTGMDYGQLFEQEKIKVEPLTYIRGRSLPCQFIIADEMQNTTLHEIKTLITRCGEKTKIVLTGDPEQIDAHYLDKKTNGFSLAIEKMKDEEMVGHITLSKCERSPLAELAAAKL
jgi:PhoH-like ATPase